MQMIPAVAPDTDDLALGVDAVGGQVMRPCGGRQSAPDPVG